MLPRATPLLCIAVRAPFSHVLGSHIVRRHSVAVTQRGSLLFEDTEFHPLWLRERSGHPSLVHSASQQRAFEVTDQLQLRVINCNTATDGGKIWLEYSDGVKDDITIDTLKAGAPADRHSLSQQVPKARPWHLLDVNNICHDFHQVESPTSKGRVDFLKQLLVDGVSVVKNVPNLTKGTHLLTQIGTIRSTHWGKYFDVVAKPLEGIKQDAAYSNAYVPLHTDGPYFEAPLQHQVLHCLVQSKTGGESFLADGLAAINALSDRNPVAEQILRQTLVRFCYESAETLRPHIDGTSIFFSNRVDGVLLDDYKELDAYYHARSELVKEMYCDEFAIRFRMDPNDMLIFDNRRILHGRDAFSEDAGASSDHPDKGAIAHPELVDEFGQVSRYLRGCYLDAILDTYRSHILQ